MDVFLQILEGWVYIVSIHGPLDGPLYTRAQYTPTPPHSLNYRRSGVQDWTTRKLTPPRSLNYRRSGVQDWTTRKLTPPAVRTTGATVFKTGQEESTNRVQKGKYPSAVTTSHRLR